MPQYLFESIDNPEITEYFFFTMKEVPAVSQEWVDEKGLKWKRIFTVPNASVDGNINPYSSVDFIRKTENKKGTLGDIMDKSRELSEKRAKTTGKDPVKEKYFEQYSKQRRGRKHIEESKNTKIENSDVSVSFKD